MKLEFNEILYLARNSQKTFTVLESKARRQPHIRTDKTYTAFKDIQPWCRAMLEEVPQEAEFKPKRAQALALERMIELSIKSLTEGIIPTYIKRKQQSYLEEAEAKLEMLRGLRKKLK